MSSVRTVEQFYTAAELAALLRLHVNQVRPLFRPGAIWPVVRLNARVIRAPAASVNRYLAAQTWNPKPVTAPAAPP